MNECLRLPHGRSRVLSTALFASDSAQIASTIMPDENVAAGTHVVSEIVLFE